MAVTALRSAALIAAVVAAQPATSTPAPAQDLAARQTPQKDKRTDPKKPAQDQKPAQPAPDGPAGAPAADPAPTPPPANLPPEKVEADVSARTVAIKLGFTGTEIIVFGTVDNSRQTSAESGYYDIVVALEGEPTPLVVRRKSNVAGLWMNTAALNFDRVPSYYALASTRPIEEIAEPEVLKDLAIGFDHVKIRPREGRVRELSDKELKDYRDAVVRIKQREGLFLKEDYDVAFIGRSLFRTTVELPANIAVGPVDAHVYLFRDGKLLSQYASRVNLERAGVELWLHGFANRYPLFYGLFTVAVAVSAGLLASAVFRRGAH
ncbi:MAG: TIGR02186 family protein [Hyphomicrobium sp.]